MSSERSWTGLSTASLGQKARMLVGLVSDGPQRVVAFFTGKTDATAESSLTGNEVVPHPPRRDATVMNVMNRIMLPSVRLLADDLRRASLGNDLALSWR